MLSCKQRFWLPLLYIYGLDSLSQPFDARHFGGKEIGQIYIFALLITVVVVTIICLRKSEWYLTILYNCQDKVGDYKKVFSLPSANDCRKQIRDRKGLAQGTEITLILKCKLQLLIASLHANGKSETMDGIF